MPGLPPVPPAPGGIPQITEHIAVGRFVDRAGNRRTVSIPILDKTGLTIAEVQAVMDAIGHCSNAGLFEVRAIERKFVPIVKAITFDEASPSVTDILALKFQNALNDTVRVEIPAIDDVCLTHNRRHGNTDETQLAAALVEILYLLNERGVNDNTFALAATATAARSRRTASMAIIPEEFREPGETDLPPDEPGLDVGI